MKRIIIVFVFFLCTFNPAHASNKQEFGIKPYIGFAKGSDSIPVSDYVVRNTETNEIVEQGTSSVDIGGGILVGLDAMYHFGTWSHLEVGYFFKTSPQTPNIDGSNAKFTYHAVFSSYNMSMMAYDMRFYAGLGVAYHFSPKFQVLVSEEIEQRENFESFISNYGNRIAPLINLGIERRTSKFLSLILALRASKIMYVGKDVEFPNAGKGVGNFIPTNQNGTNVEMTLGASFRF